MRAPRLFEPEVPIPEEIRAAVELWLAYKREQFKFVYKPIALAALVRRMAAWGPERAMAAVEFSMAGGWEGLFEEKRNHSKEEEAFCTPEHLAHVKRIVALRTDGPELARSLAYYRKVFESLEEGYFEPGYIKYVEHAYRRRIEAESLGPET